MATFGEQEMTLHDIYSKMTAKPEWARFVDAVSHLSREGLLEGRGDGFLVRYSLPNGKSRKQPHQMKLEIQADETPLVE